MRIACLILGLALAAAQIGDESANPFYVTDIQDDDYGYTITLKNNETSSAANADNFELSDVKVVFKRVDSNVIRFTATDPSRDRWVVPEFNPDWEKELTPSKMSDGMVDIQKSPFAYTITDTDNSEEVVTTVDTSFKYFNFYLEVGLTVPSTRLMGLGEHVTSFVLPLNGKFTIWGKDSVSPVASGQGCANLYGQHPFYFIQKENKNYWSAIYFRTSVPQDAYLKDNGDGTVTIYAHILGGIFDIFYLWGTSLDELFQKYHTIIGKPYLIPFWGLGYHQSRYGYTSIDKMKTVLSNFESNDFPLDVMWNDIDYMIGKILFTLDDDRYPGMLDWIKSIQKDGMYYIPILDSGIGCNVTDYNVFFKEGVEKDCFIKTARDEVKGKYLAGKVWPGYAAWIDFNHPDGPDLWKAGMAQLTTLVNFDGIWLDMNENSNFCDGECWDYVYPNITATKLESKRNLRETLKSNEDYHKFTEFDDLPYDLGCGDINLKTISPSGYHYTGGDIYKEKFYKEFYMHNLWHYYETKATHEYFVDTLKKRPFIITRSNRPGTGRWTSKWLGDNYSQWAYLKYSIIGVLTYQMFGFPVIGPDSCGFMGDTTDELCARWLQVGSFFPFTRDHNSIDSIDQEPYALGDLTKTAFPAAMRQKYSILRFYYSKLFQISRYGGLLVKPLSFLYPEDESAYETSPTHFVIGDAILVSPVVDKSGTSVSTYFPNANWYQLPKGYRAVTYTEGGSGTTLSLDGGYTYVNTHLLGGSIIPFQDSVTKSLKRAIKLVEEPVIIYVALDHNNKAKGLMVADDGESIDTISGKKFRQYTFSYEDSKLTVKTENPDGISEDYEYEKLSTLKFLGLGKEMNGRYTASGTVYPLVGSYDSSNDVLTFTTTEGISFKNISLIELF